MISDSEPEQPAILLFDGVCNLCTRSVTWILERDRHARIHFASLQSDAAKRELQRRGVAPEQLPDSLILLDAEGVHDRSEAALRVARLLGFPYALLAAGRILPRPVRDAVYRYIAARRYRWFGKQEHCYVPRPEWRDRFIDAE
jgi:predicted DCC family thiol-disulfide oxidoreductase YuxK